MPTMAEIAERREQIAQYMRRSIFSPRLIAKALNIDENTVKNDQRTLRKNSRKWLSEVAIDGLVHDTELAIAAFRDIEAKLQKMISDFGPKYDTHGNMTDAGNPFLVRMFISELRETINKRLETESNGPTLMALKTKLEENNG